MKKMFFVMFVLFCVFLTFGCDERNGNADQKQTAETERLMTEAYSQVGMPNVKNFQELKLARLIIEQCDREDLICYAYIVNLNGDLIFIGECIGYGLPYSVQFTNPQKIVDYGKMLGHNLGYKPGLIPQPDPSGLFKPDGLSATWLMMVDKEGKARPVYIEPQIIVSPFPLK